MMSICYDRFFKTHPSFFFQNQGVSGDASSMNARSLSTHLHSFLCIVLPGALPGVVHSLIQWVFPGILPSVELGGAGGASSMGIEGQETPFAISGLSESALVLVCNGHATQHHTGIAFEHVDGSFAVNYLREQHAARQSVLGHLCGVSSTLRLPAVMLTIFTNASGSHDFASTHLKVHLSVDTRMLNVNVGGSGHHHHHHPTPNWLGPQLALSSLSEIFRLAMTKPFSVLGDPLPHWGKVSSSPSAPAPITDMQLAALAESKGILLRNLSPDTSSEGEAWVLSKKRDDTSIHTADIPGSKLKRWKVTAVLQARSPFEITQMLLSWHYRLQWDDSLSEGRDLARYEDQRIDFITYSSKEAAGGWISPRAFVDMRQMEVSKDDGNGTSRLQCWCVGIESPPETPLAAEFDSLEIVEDKPGMVRGQNKAGSGFQVETLKEHGDSAQLNEYRLTILSCSDVKGSIPVSIINGALTSQFMGMTAAMESALAKGLVLPKDYHPHFASLSSSDGEATDQLVESAQ
jgi:hypothetical protein